jgi:phage gp16-like protein
MSHNYRAGLLKRIHVLKRELSFDDETYRTVLQSITGKRSCSDIDDEYLDLVCKSLEGQLKKTVQTRVRQNVQLERKIAKLGYILRWNWHDIAGFCLKETGKRTTRSCNTFELNKVVNGMIAVIDSRMESGVIAMPPSQLSDYLRHTHNRRIKNAVDARGTQSMEGVSK